MRRRGAVWMRRLAGAGQRMAFAAGVTVAVTVLTVVSAQGAFAQDVAAPDRRAPDAAAFRTPILTLNEERLFEESLWGKRVAADREAAAAALTAENRRIEGELAAEEKALTERRAKMDPAAFRAEADAFDQKVTGIRNAQDTKARSLTRTRDVERRAFFAAALPLLSEVMATHGAMAILDGRAIFIAETHLDVTDEVRALVDARLGPGAAPQGDAAPEPDAAPAPGGAPSGLPAAPAAN